MTEEQKYRVLRNLGSPRIELREYESCVLAEVVVLGDYGRATNLGFRPLVNYISRHKIAMTAPVIQESAAADAWRVSFVMPADASLERLPIPEGRSVSLREVPAQLAAAIKFAGVATPASIARQEAELRKAIAEAGLRTVGDIRIARFDPPWKPGFLRRNEVVLEVEPPR